MFDDLLSQFDRALAEAKAIKKNKVVCLQSERSDVIGCDYTKPLGAVCSFGKSHRFKQLQKEELKTNHIEWSASSQQSVENITTFSFPKGERFQVKKEKYVQTYINPNYAVVKKNTSNNVPVYKKPVVKDLAKSNVSTSTVDSQSLRGPGVYQIKEEVKVKNGVFLKDKRFKQQRANYQDVPLIISQNQTRKRPPSAVVMKKKTQQNRQLISRQQQEQLREKLKFIYWTTIPLELDRLFKTSIGPVMREQYFNLSKLKGIEKRSAILMLMDRLRYQRGGFEYQIKGTMDSACAVVYRKSTPKPFKFSEMQPGPDYYYPTDDLIRPQPRVFTLKKAGIKQKKKEYDNRDYQIRQELIKKGGNIVINPIHQQHRLTEEQIASLERGPGFYDCLFGQVEKRNDIGVVKFQQITQKNDRANNCVEVKEVNDGIYYPSYQAIDANVPAPLFKQPSDVKPAHLPEKILFPQHWLFYSGDLNKVRAQIAKNIILAKNMSFKEYKVYSEKLNRFKEYLALQKRTPEVGEYQVSYDVVDPHVADIDMAKQSEKTLMDPIVKPHGHSEGDNLVFNPKGLEEHLPNMQFKKMAGRQDDTDIDKNGEAKQGDRLILNPLKPEKHIASIDFNKQQNRPIGQQYGEHQAGPEGDILILNPQAVQKHVQNIDFSKQADRKQIKTDKNQFQQQTVLRMEQKPVIKGVGFSRMSSVRLVPYLKSHQKKQSCYNKD